MRIFDEMRNEFTKKENLLQIAWVGALFSISALLLFYNTFRYSMPLGYGGLYALMAEEIAAGNFAIPVSVSYYGPGGIPFAYPPLAFYMAAALLKLDISVITILRLLPPLLSLLSLAPLYLLAKDQSDSSFAAGLTVLYAACSPSLYVMHVWSAGMVRALAFLFMLCGLYALYRALRDERLSFASLAGLFLGLTTLTHLFYALVFALWAASLFLINIRRLFAWKIFASTAMIALVCVTPWVFLMARRYGLEIFLNAFSSHDNAAFMEIVGQPDAIFSWFFGKLFALTSPLPALILIVCGLVYLIVKRRFSVPLALVFFALLLSGEGDRFIALLGAILFGFGGMALTRLKIGGTAARPVLFLFGGAAALQTLFFGFQEIRNTLPLLNEYTFETAKYVRANMSPSSRYLFVTGQAEAEWFPYLLRREPFVSKWGSEWLGTYYEQRALQMAVSNCRDAQSLECLKRLDIKFSSEDFLITKRSEKRLMNELESSPSCERIAAFGGYIIWQAQCLNQ